MATGDRGRGLDALKSYYSASELSKKMSFDELVAHYDGQVPTWIERLGGAIRSAEVTPAELSRAFEQIIDQNPTGVPDFNSFFEALAGDVSSVHFETIVKVAKQTIQDVEQAATVGFNFAKIALIAGGLMAVAYIASPLIMAKRRRS